MLDALGHRIEPECVRERKNGARQGDGINAAAGVALNAFIRSQMLAKQHHARADDSHKTTSTFVRVHSF